MALSADRIAAVEHQKPRRPRPEPTEHAERADVHVAVNRCPFCHDDVDIDQDDWVSCRSCQARHHAACWQESGCCSSCGGDRYLADATLVAQKTLVSFDYDAVDGQGNRKQGTIVAADSVDAVTKIKASGWFPMKLTIQGGEEATRALKANQVRLRRTLLSAWLGTIALVAAIATIGDQGRDAAIGGVIAGAAGLAFGAELLRLRVGYVIGGFIGLVGGGLAVTSRVVDHIHTWHPETLWIGLALGALGLLILAGSRWTQSKPPEQPTDAPS